MYGRFWWAHASLPNPSRESRSRHSSPLISLISILCAPSRLVEFSYGVDVSSLSSLRLDLLNGATQPVPHRILDFLLRTALVKAFECFPFFRERDVATRNLRSALVGWNQLHQNALFARRGVLPRVIIHTARRIFEGQVLSPRFPRRTAIATLFEDLQFELQHIQQVAIIYLPHWRPPYADQDCLTGMAKDVVEITVGSDEHHNGLRLEIPT